MNTKKVLCILLALLLTLPLLPASAWAVDSEVPGETFTGPIRIVDAAEYIPTTKLPGGTLFPSALDGNGYVKLKDSNEVRWIDRLDLTGADYTMEFYNWLVENSDGDGVEDALIDPSTNSTMTDYGYAHMAAEIPVEIPFSYAGSDISTAATAALQSALNQFSLASARYMHSAYYAFDRDHPEVFWLRGSVSAFAGASGGWVSSYDSNTETGIVSACFSPYFILSNSSFDIRADEYLSVDAIYATIAKRDNCTNTILAEVSAGASRYETLQVLNNWLTTHNAYNTSSNLSSSVIGDGPRSSICALEGRVGLEGPVCESYSRAFKVLCDRLGIPCVLVDGANHMWNNVQMEDGNWYAVDVTWNDPGTGSVAVSGHEHEGYLLVGSNTVIWGDTFISEHPVENTPSSDTNIRFPNGPVLCEVAFDPTAPIPHTHSYGSPVFSWQSDYSACVVSVTCTGCEEGTEGHSLTADCTISTVSSGAALTVTASALLGGEEVSDEKVMQAEMGESTVTITLPMVCDNMYVLVVSYNSDGQMTGCQMLTADQATLEAETNGTQVSVFFPDTEDYTPHLGVWNLN